MTTKQNPFQKGDKVRCIDDHGGEHASYLVYGHEYEIGDTSDLAGEPQVVLNVPHKHKTWYAKRFVLVTP